MRAVLCKAYGPPETLVVEEVPVPEPGPGQVRIRIAAGGVNFPDTLIIEGKYQFRPEPPFSPGAEVAGTIDAVGEGVHGFASGDRVMALTGWGGFAEQVVVDAERAMSMPDGMDMVTGAAFSMVYGTAIHALVQRGRLKAGETLLVLGAGGGVGLAAVEIGRLLGARVIAAAGEEAKREAARRAGADIVFDYRNESLRDKVKALTEGRGADVIFDPVGGDAFDEAVRCVNWGGRILVVGFASGRIPQLPVNLALLKGCDIVGVFWGAFRKREPEADRANFDRLFAWHAEGRLHPCIGTTLPLERATEALQALLRREVVGKVVLIADPTLQGRSFQ